MDKVVQKLRQIARVNKKSLDAAVYEVFVVSTIRERDRSVKRKSRFIHPPVFSEKPNRVRHPHGERDYSRSAEITASSEERHSADLLLVSPSGEA